LANHQQNVNLEEHFRTPEMSAALAALGPEQRDDSLPVLESAEKKKPGSKTLEKTG